MLGIVPSLCSVTEITMWELVLSLLQVKERVGEVVLNLRPCSWKEGILIYPLVIDLQLEFSLDLIKSNDQPYLN